MECTLLTWVFEMNGTSIRRRSLSTVTCRIAWRLLYKRKKERKKERKVIVKVIDKLKLKENQDSQVSVTTAVEVVCKWMGTIYGLAECMRNFRNSIRKCGKRQENKDNNCNVQHWFGKPMFYYRLVEGDYNDFNHFDFHFVYAQLNMNWWS